MVFKFLSQFKLWRKMQLLLANLGTTTWLTIINKDVVFMHNWENQRIIFKT